MIRHSDDFAAALRIVFDHQLNGVDNGHGTRSIFVQIFADAGFQGSDFDSVVLLGHADAFAELTDRLSGIAATAQAGNGRHTRVIPAFDVFFRHQLIQLTLGHHGVFKVEAREFILTRMHGNADVIQHPIVQAAVILKLESTQRVGNSFQRIADAVGKVVHRVDAPLASGLMVIGKLNTVQYRIAHHDKRRSHIDFRAQAGFTLGKSTATHFFKQRQVLFHAAIAIRAIFTRLFQGAAVLTDLIR